MDVTTAVTYYPEIYYLPKLDDWEVGDASNQNSETYMETIRVDIFATHAGRMFHLSRRITTTVPGVNSTCPTIGWWNCLLIRTRMEGMVSNPESTIFYQSERHWLVSSYVYHARE